jgi:NAD(P)-dependent dehydrogenase (short-subunit alcohol dehydrogenase family)
MRGLAGKVALVTGVNVLVNVVGGVKSYRMLAPFLEISEAQWDSAMALNLKAALHFI